MPALVGCRRKEGKRDRQTPIEVAAQRAGTRVDGTPLDSWVGRGPGHGRFVDTSSLGGPGLRLRLADLG
jgi:hypothetical protein